MNKTQVKINCSTFELPIKIVRATFRAHEQLFLSYFDIHNIFSMFGADRRTKGPNSSWILWNDHAGEGKRKKITVKIENRRMNVKRKWSV